MSVKSHLFFPLWLVLNASQEEVIKKQNPFCGSALHFTFSVELTSVVLLCWLCFQSRPCGVREFHNQPFLNQLQKRFFFFLPKQIEGREEGLIADEAEVGQCRMHRKMLDKTWLFYSWFSLITPYWIPLFSTFHYLCIRHQAVMLFQVWLRSAGSIQLTLFPLLTPSATICKTKVSP